MCTVRMAYRPAGDRCHQQRERTMKEAGPRMQRKTVVICVKAIAFVLVSVGLLAREETFQHVMGGLGLVFLVVWLTWTLTSATRVP
jgi:L-asparagine transporter-like permease